MEFDYEITERDFLDGQHLAIKNHPKRIIRWMRHYFFVLGIMGLGFSVHVVITQGFSLRVIWALILPLLFISYPNAEHVATRKSVQKDHGPTWQVPS